MGISTTDVIGRCACCSKRRYLLGNGRCWGCKGRAVAVPGERIPLTPRQQEWFDAMKRLTADRGRQPDYREWMAAMGCTSMNAVAQTVDALVRKGWLRRNQDGVSGRSLYLTPDPGTVAALKADAEGGWLLCELTEDGPKFGALTDDAGKALVARLMRGGRR